MDDRLVAPFDVDSLIMIAALAAGYGTAAPAALPSFELATMFDHPQPHSVAVRLAARAVRVHPDSVMFGTETVATLSRELVDLTAPATPARDIAHLVVQVACNPARFAASMVDHLLEPVSSAGDWDRLDLFDGAFTGLRAALTALTGRRLGNPEASQLVAISASANLA